MRYSKDFRAKVMGTKERLSLSVRETANRFRIAPATVQSWSGRLEAKQPGTTAGLGRKLPRAALQDFMRKHPDAYQAEVAEYFGVARFAVWRALGQIGGSRKKTWEHPKVSIQSRTAYQQRLAKLSHRPVVYLDESGFAVDMPRRHG